MDPSPQGQRDSKKRVRQEYPQKSPTYEPRMIPEEQREATDQEHGYNGCHTADDGRICVEIVDELVVTTL